MPEPSWFNANANRAYPLAAGAAAPPPHALLVDAGFVTGAKSRFAAGDSVTLAAVRRRGAYFFIDFTSDAPELYGLTLTFSRHAADADFAYEFVDSGTAGLSASSESRSASDPRSLCDAPLWAGFLVTGPMAAFEAVLPGDGDVAYAAAVEPGLVQNLAEAFVTKLGVANGDRTHATPPAGCGDGVQPDETRVNAGCVTGAVVFRPGYNATVRQNPADNSITFGAAVGAGAGRPCAPPPSFPGEVPPGDSSLLEGGPACADTLRAVNGLGGPLLTLVAGSGVRVVADPDANRLVVTVDMTGLVACYDASAVSESV